MSDNNFSWKAELTSVIIHHDPGPSFELIEEEQVVYVIPSIILSCITKVMGCCCIMYEKEKQSQKCQKGLSCLKYDLT